MSVAKIRSALVSGYIAGAFNIVTQYENEKSLDTDTSVPFCQFLFIPNQPVPVTLGDEGEDEFTGVVNLILNYPINSGIGAALEKADEIKGHFKPGFGLSYDGQTVKVVRSGLTGGGENSNGFYQAVVTITWNAKAKR